MTGNTENGLQNGDIVDPPVFKGTTKFEPDPNIRNVMVTGGAGFIASWVVRHLTLSYPDAYKIISYDKIDYCASLNNTKCLRHCSNFEFVHGDVTDQQAVLQCMRKYEIDTVLHFAAMSHVDLSFGNSFAFTKNNVEGTHVMLESAVKVGVKRFIHVSTDEVNGETKHEDPDLLEDSILAPTNPYAASKAAAEMYVNAYAKSFKLPCIIVRSNNVYGPHQYPEKIIPKFSCLLDRQRPLILHGNGNNTRRYLFAGDSADAFDTILHKGNIGEIYNVDSVDEISNKDLAIKMLAHFGILDSQAETWIQHVHDRPFNDMRYAVDARKLRSLGWVQKTSFEDGLRITVDWYNKFGRTWWPEVESVLTAFPEVAGFDTANTDDPRKLGTSTPLIEIQEDRLAKSANEALSDGNGLLAVPQVALKQGGGGPSAIKNERGKRNTRKRGRDEDEEKENEPADGTAKRVFIGEGLENEEVVR